MKKNFLFLMVFYYIFIIFSFSLQPAVSSAAESKGLVEFVYELLTKFKIFPSFSKMEFTDVIVPIARKMAHFGNFFILSCITFLYIECYEKSRFNSFCHIIVLCLFVAITDEILQNFSAGRACRAMDVVIDFSGATLGALVLFIYQKFCKE